MASAKSGVENYTKTASTTPSYTSYYTDFFLIYQGKRESV